MTCSSWLSGRPKIRKYPPRLIARTPRAWRPDGDWYKEFGTFKLCGTGKYASTFLLAGQAARGKKL